MEYNGNESDTERKIDTEIEQDTGRKVDTKYLVWVGETGCGGLGDRFVGMTACKIIAETIKRKFLVHWISPDISSALTLQDEYNYLLYEEKVKDKRSLWMRWVDDFTVMDWMTSQNLDKRWENVDVLFIKNNQPFHICLWSNPHYRDLHPMEKVTMDAYWSILSLIFTMTDELDGRLSYYTRQLRLGDRKEVTLHMRLGDWHMNIPRNDKARDEDSQNGLLKKDIESFVKSYAREFRPFYQSHIRRIDTQQRFRIVLLSDADTNCMINSFEEIFKEEMESGEVEFLTTDGEIIHLDQTEEKKQSHDGIVKIMVDMILTALSTCLVFWDNTNFARVGALMKPSWMYESLKDHVDIWLFNTKSRLFTHIKDPRDIIPKRDFNEYLESILLQRMKL